MGKRIQVGQSIFLCHAISFVRLMNQKVVVQYTSPKSDSFNPLNPEKNLVVGSPTLGLQPKNKKNLFSNFLPW